MSDGVCEEIDNVLVGLAKIVSGGNFGNWNIMKKKASVS